VRGGGARGGKGNFSRSDWWGEGIGRREAAEGLASESVGVVASPEKVAKCDRLPPLAC